MLRKRQQGFAIVEALLIVILVAIIGFTGYYVWHAQKGTNEALNEANKSSAATAKNSPTLKNSNSNQKHLVIKEWGIKLPLTNDLSDAYYRYDDSNDTVYLSKTVYKGTDCAADQVTLGALMRFTGDQKAQGEDGSEAPGLMTAEFPNAVHIGSHYYQYIHPQAGCGFTSPSGSDLSNDPGATKSIQYMSDFADAATKITAAD